ncbi:MAG: hypothetical protein WBP72_01505 [Rhodocyclaceae bacterium]|jgi:hypothetical protein
MTLCPVAIMAGCKKCPVVGMCPLKTVIGNYNEEEKSGGSSASAKATSPKQGDK